MKLFNCIEEDFKMAKTIKFNLICDDKPVRTIEDLQNNFSIEDVLEYYKNKLLHRWLEVRGYSEELEKVEDISEEKPIEIIKKLIKIFDVVCDNKKVEEGVYILDFLDERKFLCEEYNKQNYKAKQVIDDYEAGYIKLVDGIINNPNNAAQIKANISEIVTNYAWILELDYRNLYYKLRYTSDLALMCLLMNQKSRKYFFPIKIEQEDGTLISDIEEASPNYNFDKKYIYNEICEHIKTSSFINHVKDDLYIFSGVTDGYWKDLEPKEKKYMIISMGNGDYVRSAGISGGDMSSNDVLNEFVIVDGIDYKSNSASRQLMYMEV